MHRRLEPAGGKSTSHTPARTKAERQSQARVRERGGSTGRTKANKQKLNTQTNEKPPGARSQRSRDWSRTRCSPSWDWYCETAVSDIISSSGSSVAFHGCVFLSICGVSSSSPDLLSVRSVKCVRSCVVRFNFTALMAHRICSSYSSHGSVRSYAQRELARSRGS